MRPLRTTGRALAATLSLLAICALPAVARAAEDAKPTPPATPWNDRHFPNGGDYGAYFVERFGGLVLPNATRGASGSTQGAGLEARWMMPVGWGAYTRLVRNAQSNFKCAGECATWDQWDLAFGMSKRLQATPQKPAFREQIRLDLGFLYGQAATRGSCERGLFLWSYACQSGSTTGLNGTTYTPASGAALGLEARLAVEVGVGPIGLGLDFGGAAFKSITTGTDSAEIPSLFFAWSAQARAGLAWSIE